MPQKSFAESSPKITNLPPFSVATGGLKKRFSSHKHSKNSLKVDVVCEPIWSYSNSILGEERKNINPKGDRMNLITIGRRGADTRRSISRCRVLACERHDRKCNNSTSGDCPLATSMMRASTMPPANRAMVSARLGLPRAAVLATHSNQPRYGGQTRAGV